MASGKRAVSLWANNPATVAALLVDKVFSVDDVKNIVVLEAEGFGRESGKKHPYTPMLAMEPGDVYCAPFMGIPLLVIVTLDNGEMGGRVLIRRISVDGKVVKGPKKISQELGLVLRQTGIATWRDQSSFTITFE
jgi:hypothetical protein